MPTDRRSWIGSVSTRWPVWCATRFGSVSSRPNADSNRGFFPPDLVIDPITVGAPPRHVLDVTGDPPRQSESATPGPPRPNLRVLVADDSSSFREILCSFLESLPGVELCGAVGDGL